MSRITFLVMAVLLVATAAFAQLPTRAEVDQLWLQICQFNRSTRPLNTIGKPDSNAWQPADTMWIPGGYVIVTDSIARYPYMVAQGILTGHAAVVWDSVEAANQLPVGVTKDRFPWLFVICAAAFFGMLVYLAYRQRRRQAAVNFPPFVPAEQIPNFMTASTQNTTHLVDRVLNRLGLQRVGDSELGFVRNGQQKVYFAGASAQVFHFDNEKAWRVMVQFPNGKQEYLYARYSCFNPMVGATGAGKFKGAWVPIGQGAPEQMAQSVEAERYLDTATATPEATAASTSVTDVTARKPETVDQAPKAEIKTAPATEVKRARTPLMVHLTKFQVSKDKGLNMEGEIDLPVKDLKDLVDRFAK